MNPTLKKFVYKEAVVSAIIILIAAPVFIIFPEYYHPVYPVILVYFTAFTTTVHGVLLNKTQKNPNSFPKTFLVITTVRIFLSLFVLIALILINKQYIIPLIILFLVHYVVFQALEIMSILKESKKK